MKPRSDRQETFLPLRDKTLAQVLLHLFVTEFGYENKRLFAQAMIERILETLEAFIRPVTALQPGQMLWMAVVHDGRKHACKPMGEIPQVAVVLDLVTDEDLEALASGEDLETIRQRRYARLLKQAFAQGGVLAQSDLAAIALVSHSKVGAALRAYQQGEGELLPYRGSVQDLGATLSHRVEVARLLEAGYLEPEICCRLSVVHDLSSVENYAQTYKNVLKLLERGFAPEEISAILSISIRLVRAYIELVQEHHPEIVAANPHLRGAADHQPDVNLGVK